MIIYHKPIKGPLNDLFFAQNHALQEKIISLISRKTFYITLYFDIFNPYNKGL